MLEEVVAVCTISGVLLWYEAWHCEGLAIYDIYLPARHYLSSANAKSLDWH